MGIREEFFREMNGMKTDFNVYEKKFQRFDIDPK